MPWVNLSRTNNAPRLILNSHVLVRGLISESHLKSENSSSITGSTVAICEARFECFLLTSLNEPAPRRKFKWANTWSRLKMDSLRCPSASSPRNSSSSAINFSKRCFGQKSYNLKSQEDNTCTQYMNPVPKLVH